jgi:hypothetical protein
LDLLQLRLDGEAGITPPAVAAHLAVCADCRGRFAAAGLLLAAVEVLDLPVRPMVTEWIVAGAISDSRRRRRVRRCSLAAAGMAAAVTAVAFWLTQEQPSGPGSVRIVAAPPDLRRDATEAGEAVAAITRRAAVDAVDAGRQLVPAVPPPPWPPALEPAHSFDEAGAALADGLEPMATSARRAALLFWRELPVTERKVD